MNFHIVSYQNHYFDESITLPAMLHIPSPVLLIDLQLSVAHLSCAVNDKCCLCLPPLVYLSINVESNKQIFLPLI